MRSKIILAGLAILFVTSAIHAQKVKVDVDKSFNFSTFKTFAWSKGQVAPSPSTSQMLIAAVERELTSRGLVKNDEHPDLRIAVMAAPDMDLQGVGPSWNNTSYRSWGGYGNPAALMNIGRGTLLIDLLETKKEFSIWRGVSKDIFVASPSGDPEKDLRHMQELVDKTVRKMFQKYPVKAHG